MKLWGCVDAMVRLVAYSIHDLTGKPAHGGARLALSALGALALGGWKVVHVVGGGSEGKIRVYSRHGEASFEQVGAEAGDRDVDVVLCMDRRLFVKCATSAKKSSAPLINVPGRRTLPVRRRARPQGQAS